MITLELYRIFYTVAKCGTSTRAAAELCVTQPAVSQAIKQLENQLGVKLFNRTYKGMWLTSRGKQIFGRVETALELLKDVESDIGKSL